MIEHRSYDNRKRRHISLRELVSQLLEAVEYGRSVAYTALVETRGSTPQKAGAAMLVFPDGSQKGTLGGGCVEAEVKRRSLALLKDGEREIMAFQLDNDYGWDDGLICGGRMSMLVDPLRPGGDVSYFRTLAELLNQDQACTEAVVVSDTVGRPGDRFLLADCGRVVAARAIGDIPSEAAVNLRDVRTRPRPYVAGGVSFLPYSQRCRLVIVGAGHVGQKVAALASDVGFRVWVADDRDDYCSKERFPTAERLLIGPIEQTAPQFVMDENTFCIVVTRGHNHDEEALFQVIDEPARYVGMIGSKRKIRMIFDDLKCGGKTAEAVARVHAPLGFDIGSQTVAEIAVSIVAELIAHRNLDVVPSGLTRVSLA